MRKIKKIFKAILLGWRESDVISGFLKYTLEICWLPVCFKIFFRIFKLDITNGEFAAIFLPLTYIGVLISRYINHCVDAIRYQEEHQCKFSEAWNATEIDCVDDF